MKIQSLRMLQHFLTAARTRNLHSAAKAESLTQPAITKSLRQLESRLGVELFDRSVKGVALNSYGKAILSRAERIEAECGFIERELEEMATGRSGTLTIGAGSVWSTVLLPEIIATLQRERPSASFIVRRSAGPRFGKQIAHGEIDIGLGYAEKQAILNKDLVFEPLSRFGAIFLARRGHPLHSRKNLKAVDLQSCLWATFQLDDALYERMSAFFLTQGCTLPPPSFLADSISSVLSTLGASDMITCLPEPLGQLARKFDVVPLDVRDNTISFQSGVVYGKSGRGYPLLEETLTVIRNSIAQSALQ